MASTKLLRNEKLRHITIERAEKFISKEWWNDVNLSSKLYSRRLPQCVTFSVFSVVGTDVCNTDKMSYAEAIQQKFEHAELGKSYGPSWATHWFKVQIQVPKEIVGEEIHLLWDNGCEALIYRDGVPVQSLYGGNGDDRREEYLLTRSSTGGESFELYIEMACNGMFGNPGPGGFLKPPVSDLTFKHSMAELGVLNKNAWKLFWDMDVIIGMAKQLPDESSRSWEASSALEQICNICWPDQPDTYEEALKISSKFLSKHSGQAAHQITACGHCHIDTAWLWTYSETRRKCARSWSSQLTLMNEFPQYVFAASQAQQFEWTKENYPKLFKQMQEQPRFVPTGGTWVEMDCNIPSGESFIRQFLYGQRFFEKEFGKKCTEFWLPDTFGYSAQLPQIIKGCEMEFFLTQKLSWNLINKFPHSTFYWQGLDGTKVLSHFPPADTYCSNSSVKELLDTVKNHKNKETSNSSMLLFGFGDGGGGPTRPLLERLKRVENTDSMPAVKYQPPAKFFEELKAEPNHPIWVGELYFELHRGTYTTHALVKRNNRKCEFLLTNIELLSSLASLNGYEYPKTELDRLWKLLLLNQFHDVIPGTSIPPVYLDAHRFYNDIYESGAKLLKSAYESLGKKGTATTGSCVAINPLSWGRTEVVTLPAGIQGIQKANGLDDGEHFLGIAHDVPSLGYKQFSADSLKQPHAQKVTINEQDGHFVLQNSFLKATFSKEGLLTSLIHNATQRETIDSGDKQDQFGNQFLIFEDIPFYWDAWDVMIYHQHKYRFLKGATSVEIAESGPLRVGLKIKFKISDASHISQFVYLDCLSENLVFDTLVDWHENRKFLKVQFSVTVMSNVANYSIQFGHAQRPTHTNTSWDAAKFEVCGHHWADLSEYGFGVALLNDCKYGYAVQQNVMRLSLLRSSKMPDDTADMGTHRFKYAIRPHKGDHLAAALPREGYAFNQPLIINETNVEYPLTSAFTVQDPNIQIECLKQAEPALDGSSSNSLVLRIWETHGGRGVGTIETTLPFTSAHKVNMLENMIGDTSVQANKGTIKFKYSPFQVITLKLSF